MMDDRLFRKGACALALVLTTGAVLAACSNSNGGVVSSYDGVATVLQAALPQKPAADDYEAQSKVLEDNKLDQAFLDNLSTFSYRSAPAVFAEASEANENYSPASLYYALAMTQMGAAGSTQDEIAALLGADNVDVTAQQCGNLLRLLAADQYSNVKLANSVWMSPDAEFNQGFVDVMRDQFYASLFQTDFGTPEADKAMGQWVADNTEGTLAPQFKSESQQLISLINTVYFKSEWSRAFDAESVSPETFNAETGKVTADFMVQRLDGPQEIRATDTYTRASLGFADGSQMTFVLPAQGVHARDLLADAAALEEAFTADSTGEAFVTYHVPKFSFDSSYDLVSSLKKLGVNRAFSDQADFSNLTDIPAYVSSVAQEGHIGLDENGVEASAYTKVDIMAMSALPDPAVVGELDFNLDRPFLYEIKSKQGAVLFLGMCGDPSAGK
ncbi:MAG: hypothetical protein PEGG_01442 [Paraeggerthella hongkongensis]|uniref:serpin family protein n=1 Tax=Paraeggerthella TaxID=651554 RepID=UPI001C0FE64D|nr:MULTISPECIES: serpin family protein [Paraeggerthella]MBU5406379.1 serpin family protein [Paraeggerthella hongkongensis]MCD2432747.1 serpin family protein [Paraeggerthella hominis]